MRIFVTGLSGFIGSHTARILLEAGCEVLGLVRPGSDLWRLRGLETRVEIVYGDLSHPETYQPTVDAWQPQACIHLAWYAKPGEYLHSNENLRSLQDSIDLMLFLAKTGCKTIVMAGTCAEYEMQSSMLNEDSKLKPSTLYAACKLAISLIGSQLAEASNINFSWARFFYVYGPYEDKRRLVPAAINSFLEGKPFLSTPGEQVRDYLHVEDLARAMWRMAEVNANDTFNVSSGVPLTVATLLQKIAELTAKAELLRLGELSYRDWEPMYICGDNSRLLSLGWKPRFSLEDGLRQTIGFWKSNT